MFLTLTIQEERDLGWLADRYESARVIFDEMIPVEEDSDDSGLRAIYKVPQETVRRFRRACAEEDGGFIPCCGGPLRDKLSKFLERGK